MHFTRRLHAVWNWLPAFRAVAETEHLPTAARELGVVASSLSRSVRLLEEEIGVTLFDRVGHRIVLNDAGRAFLSVVRDAMRQLDEGVNAAAGNELRGVVSAAAGPDLGLAIVARAVSQIAAAYPGLRVALAALRDAEIAAQLMRGDVDAAVVTAVPEHDDLRADRIATLSRSAYRGSDSSATPAPMVVVGARGELPDDGWPPDRARQIAAWVPDERTALEMCRTGGLCVVAYDILARPWVVEGGLVRCEEPTIADRPIYAVRRRPVTTHRRVDILVDALRAAATALASSTP